jgi:glutamyl-tRNA reductase
MNNKITGVNLYVAGINYRKTDVLTRGQYALSADMITTLLTQAGKAGITEMLVLSTCNRTEIYGYTTSPYILIALLCDQTTGNAEDFIQAAYIKKDQKAAEHLFQVAAGLDSQILGDYEIVGQLKSAYRQSKQLGMIGSQLSQLINAALRSSREIKNNTSISSGTISVSFSAVRMAKNYLGDITNIPILLVGTGKIGRNTCRNLVDHAGARNVTLVNRTRLHAKQLAAQYDLQYAPLELLHGEISKAEIIITATSSATPTIFKKDLEGGGRKLIIDLSVPANVAPDVALLDHIRVISVDELSKAKDETVALRSAGIPEAKRIIATHLYKFQHWQERRKDASILHHLKTTLLHIHTHPEFSGYQRHSQKTVDNRIRKLLGETAKKLSEQDRNGCHFIFAINQFMN